MKNLVIAMAETVMFFPIAVLLPSFPVSSREYSHREEVPKWTVVSKGGLWCRDPETMKQVLLTPEGGVVLSKIGRTGNIRQIKEGEMWLFTDHDCIVRARTEYIKSLK